MLHDRGWRLQYFKTEMEEIKGRKKLRPPPASSRRTDCAAGRRDTERLSAGRFGVDDRQLNNKLRLAWLCRKTNLTAVMSDYDAMRDVESKPGSHTQRLRGEEWLKDSGTMLSRDAWPLVRHPNANPIAFFPCPHCNLP